MEYNQKLNVLFITRKWPPAIGGMEVYSQEMVYELKKLTNLTSKVLPGRVGGRPPTAFRLLLFVLSMFGYIALGRRADVLHLGDLVLWPIALISWLFRSHKQLVISAHGLDIAYGLRKGIRPYLYRQYIKSCVICCSGFLCVVANSHATAELCTKAGFRNVVVVPLGVRMHDPLPLNNIGDRPYVLFVGRLIKRKGAGWFVRNVLPHLPNDINLKIAGTRWDDSEWEVISQDPRVEFLGPIFGDDLSRLRRNSVAVLMPNIHCGGHEFEGFGLTALEAAADGGVLLASGIDGIVDAVINKVTGYLLRASDVSAWLDMINELKNWDELKRQAFIAGARKKIANNFSWERVAGDTVEVYKSNLIRKKSTS